MNKIEKLGTFEASDPKNAHKVPGKVQEIIEWQQEMVDNHRQYNADFIVLILENKKLEARIESLEKRQPLYKSMVEKFEQKECTCGCHKGISTGTSYSICNHCLPLKRESSVNSAHSMSTKETSWYETFKTNQAALGTIKQEKWQPKESEHFWYVDSLGNVAYKHERGSAGDELVSYGNYFETEQEAEAMRDRIKSLLEAR